MGNNGYNSAWPHSQPEFFLFLNGSISQPEKSKGIFHAEIIAEPLGNIYDDEKKDRNSFQIDLSEFN